MGDLFKGAVFGGLVGTAICSFGILMINSRYQEIASENETLRSRITNSISFEDKLSDGGKGYVLDLEGKVKPGNYMLATDESDVCRILSYDVQVRPGNYKLMFVESVKKSEQTPSPLNPPSENYRTSMKIVNPDGNVHYSVQVRDAKGKLLREYIEPSNERLERNPDYKSEVDKPESDKPIFHSTTPVFKNPDGSIDAYRPLKEGETLEDVTREGPVDSYVPSNK